MLCLIIKNNYKCIKKIEFKNKKLIHFLYILYILI